MSPFAFLKLRLGTIGWYSDKAKQRKMFFLMTMLLVLPILFIPATLDNDIWFILNHGRYIMEHGFTNIEPFTVHEGLQFSFEKWLTCVIFWGVYCLGRAKGIYLFLVFMGIAIVAAFYKLCMELSDKNHVTSCAVTAAALLPTFMAFMVSRPQVFGYLFLVIELLLLEKYVKTEKYRYLIPLPFISILWMQLHSTMWVICLIMMLPYLCEFEIFAFKGMTAKKYRKKPLLITLGCMFLGGFINPYGARSVFYLVQSMRSKELAMIGINELSKADVSSLTLFILVAAGHIIFLWFRRKKVPVRYVLLTIGTFVMGLYAVRNMAFFTIAGGAVLAWEFKDIKIPEKWTKHGLDLLVIGIPAIALFGVLSTVSPGAEIGYFDNLYERTSCKEAVDTLADMTGKKSGLKVYTSFNDGAYAEFMGFKAYIDPRAEVFIKDINKKKDVLSEYAEFIGNTISYQEMQERYDFDYWIADKGNGYTIYMEQDPDYENVYEDDNCIVFAAKDVK